jgi:hypothetical protein
LGLEREHAARLSGDQAALAALFAEQRRPGVRPAGLLPASRVPCWKTEFLRSCLWAHPSGVRSVGTAYPTLISTVNLELERIEESGQRQNGQQRSQAPPAKPLGLPIPNPLTSGLGRRSASPERPCARPTKLCTLPSSGRGQDKSPHIAGSAISAPQDRPEQRETDELGAVDTHPRMPAGSPCR